MSTRTSLVRSNCWWWSTDPFQKMLVSPAAGSIAMTNVSTLAWPWAGTGTAVAFGAGAAALVVAVGLKAGTAFVVASGFAGAAVAAGAAAAGAVVAAGAEAGVSDVVSLPQATAIIANNITMDGIKNLSLKYRCNIPICPPTLIYRPKLQQRPKYL